MEKKMERFWWVIWGVGVEQKMETPIMGYIGFRNKKRNGKY